MTPRLALAALAPLALGLAACGDSNNVDDRVVSTTENMDEAVDVDLPDIPVETPQVAVNARNTVDYAGTYSQQTQGGGERSITLNADDTYSMRDESGVETSGSFNWYSDNSRILIRQDGETQVYAIADGAIYRLPDENASITGPMTPEQTYVRVVGPGGAMPTTASANTGEE